MAIHLHIYRAMRVVDLALIDTKTGCGRVDWALVALESNGFVSTKELIFYATTLIFQSLNINKRKDLQNSTSFTFF